MKLPRPHALVAIALACGVCLAEDPSPRPMPKGRVAKVTSSDEIPAAKLPDDLLKALQEAREVTLISLEPEAGENLPGHDTFQGWKMML